MRNILLGFFVALSAILACRVTEAEETQKFEKIALKSGKVFENVMIYSESPGYITLVTEGGLARVPKSDLPDDIAKQLNFDPQAAAAQVQAEEAKVRELAAKTEYQNMVEGVFKKYAIELELGGVSNFDHEGTYVYAFQLGPYSTETRPSVTVLGNAGLGDRVTERETIPLGTIYLKGMKRTEIPNIKRSIWACPIGSVKSTESSRSAFGYSNRNVNVPVFSTDKDEVAKFYLAK